MRIFVKEFKKIQTWTTVLSVLSLFYIVGVFILKYNTVLSIISNFSFLQSIKLILTLYVHPLDTFSILTFTTFIVTAALFALQVVALRLYVSKRFFNSVHVVSLGAVITSLIGCLACCGSILIAGMFSFFGASVGFLPFSGKEISIFAILLSSTALIYTVYKIGSPLVC